MFYICPIKQKTKHNMRYLYNQTKDYKLGLDWILSNICNDCAYFRFVVPSLRGFNRSAWMPANKAFKYIRYGGLLYDFAGSIKIEKRLSIPE